MMSHGILQHRKSSVVKQRGLERDVAQRRRPELIVVRLPARDLTGAKVLVLPGAIEEHITLAYTERRRKLGHGDSVVNEIAKHLVGIAGHRVAGDTLRVAEE